MDSLFTAIDYDKKDMADKYKEKEREREREEQRKKDTRSTSASESTCQCPNEASRVPKIHKNDQDVQALIEFENKLHDNIYVKR